MTSSPTATPRDVHDVVLAIDLGTSGPKVALVDASGEMLACTGEPTALHLLPDGGAEQDPEDWWRAIIVATKRLWADGHDPSRVVAPPKREKMPSLMGDILWGPRDN